MGGGGLIAFCRLLPVSSSFRHAHDATLYRFFSCNPRHAHDATLYRSSLAILDTLKMLRSIDLLLQSLSRS